ncbi:MAG: T9SS type A sorting domain-containing protein [Crocinitomicaceae bacterium]
MKTILPILFLLLSTTIFAQLNTKTILVDQVVRDYIEYIPQNYQNAESAPLIIVLHGIGGFISDYVNPALNGLADDDRFVSVYLQGKANAFGQTSWNNGTLLASNANDLGFIQTMIETMATEYNIDRTKVYVVGISMGAIMTYKVLHHLSDKVAAAVCHIGTMSNEEIANYNPALPRPLLQIHGVNDDVVPYAGTPLPSLSLVNPTLDKLKSINGWNGDSTITNIPDNMNDDITIEKIVYDCTTKLEHWKMSGSGAEHIFLFAAINDTSGMEVTWNFLKENTHPNPTLAIQNFKTENSKLTVYPNPTTGIFKLENSMLFKSVKIYNINQQLVFESQQLNQLDISHLSSGLYILQVEDQNNQFSNQLLNKN